MSEATDVAAILKSEPAGGGQFVTVRIGRQLIALPIAQVRDVFQIHRPTPIPNTGTGVVGLVNLRGKIVPVLCLGTLLGLDATPPKGPRMAVSIALHGEIYGLRVDQVGEVMSIAGAAGEKPLSHLAGAWVRHTRRIHKLENELLIEIDAESLLELPLVLAA